MASSILGVASSVVLWAVAHGVMKEKIRRLEETLDKAIIESKADRRDLRDEQQKFVTYTHLELVVAPLRTSLGELQRDVKEILRAVGAVS